MNGALEGVHVERFHQYRDAQSVEHGSMLLDLLRGGGAEDNRNGEPVPILPERIDDVPTAYRTMEDRVKNHQIRPEGFKMLPSIAVRLKVLNCLEARFPQHV